MFMSSKITPPPQKKKPQHLLDFSKFYILKLVYNCIATNSAEFFIEAADKRQEGTWQQRERFAVGKQGKTAKLIIVTFFILHFVNPSMFELYNNHSATSILFIR
jgi:hypothetical protein